MGRFGMGMVHFYNSLLWGGLDFIRRICGGSVWSWMEFTIFCDLCLVGLMFITV